MSTQPAALTLTAQQSPRFRLGAERLADYWALTKPEVNLLILVTTVAGFCLALPPSMPHFPALLLVNTLFGTLLVASGTGTLNQVIEQRFDAQMRRTKRRPLAAGRIARSHALWFGVALACGGCAYLGITVNVVACGLAAATLLSYLFVYTPCKRMSSFCTLVGAISGATPPLIGWSAATGKLNLEAWILYGILFLWQFPHFMAIAWMYREDYARAGYLVLPRAGAKDSLMALQSVLPCVILLMASLIAVFSAHSHFPYWVANSLIASAFLFCAGRLAFQRSNTSAKRLLSASIIYLPLVFCVILLSRF